MIIGLMGAKGSGKDSVANILVKEHGYRKVAFADPMRIIAETIDPVVGFTGASKGVVEPVHYTDAMREFGYQKAKEEYPEMRRFLQRLGTEAGREVIHEDFWVDLWREYVMDLGVDKVVASDCRFQNEVDLVRQLNGEVWTILRPGHDPKDGHPSEMGWRQITPDWEIYNDGTLEDLREEVAGEVLRITS